MAIESIAALCGWLFLDGATLGVGTTPLLLLAARQLPPLQVALFGGLASAAGAALQMLVLRRLLRADSPWLRRFLPTRDVMDRVLREHPTTSFATILVARATPLPDAPVKLVAAVAGYPLALYFLAVLLGAIPYYWALAWIGHRFRLPLWAIAAVAGAMLLAFVVDRFKRGRERGGSAGNA